MSDEQWFCLTGGTIVDGSGSPGVPGSLLVRGETIEAIIGPGEQLPASAMQVDISGMVLAPGFIDAHSHADNVPFLAEGDLSKIQQGVTTEVVGNCGFSLGPANPATLDDFTALVSRIFPPTPVQWSSFQEMLTHADAGGYITNYAPLVGHNALRVAALGSANRAPTQDELALMGGLLEEALEAGAFGLSSGLIYPPGLFSQPGEVEHLVARLGSDGVYATHMRNETARVRHSIKESLAAVAGSKTRLHISHLKIADRHQWGSMTGLLRELDAAHEAGVRVTQDAYPYAAGSTMLTALLPPWFHDGGSTAVLERLKSHEAREQARRDVEGEGAAFENMAQAAGWDGVVISSTRSHRHEGRSVQEVADERGVAPFDAAAQVLLEEELSATMVLHMMHEDDVRTVLAHPRTAVGSDGLPPGTGGKPHPRTFGTFPRVLGAYARDHQLLTLAEAVRRMTSLPAEIFGIPRRGLLRRGYLADLVVFDPDEVQGQAWYDAPTRPPTGIRRVYQAGRPVMVEGTWQGERVGRRLQPQHQGAG